MSFFCCLASIFACRLVFYLYACAVENPEIPGFCVSKSRGLRTDHKRMKKIETECGSITRTILATDIYIIELLDNSSVIALVKLYLQFNFDLPFFLQFPDGVDPSQLSPDIEIRKL